MSMLAGGNGRMKAEMNVTPMIDVLLVLIIIFMVIMPNQSEGLNAEVPRPATADQKPSLDSPLVITVFGDSTVRLNQEAPLAVGGLENRLRALYKNAAHHTIFVRAEQDLYFEQIAEVIDIAHGVGIKKVALMTPTQ